MKKYGYFLVLMGMGMSAAAYADIPIVHHDKNKNLHEEISSQTGAPAESEHGGLVNCQVGRTPPCTFKPVGTVCKGPSLIHCGALGVGCTTTCEDVASKGTNRKSASVKKMAPASGE